LCYGSVKMILFSYSNKRYQERGRKELRRETRLRPYTRQREPSGPRHNTRTRHLSCKTLRHKFDSLRISTLYLYRECQIVHVRQGGGMLCPQHLLRQLKRPRMYLFRLFVLVIARYFWRAAILPPTRARSLQHNGVRPNLFFESTSTSPRSSSSFTTASCPSGLYREAQTEGLSSGGTNSAVA
jgi:hypothetical protein